MRKRFLGMAAAVAAVASIVIGVSPASAAAGWTVTPAGNADGDAGQTILTVRPADGSPDKVLDCLSSHADITTFSSATSHVANIDDITFSDCLLAGLFTFDVDADTAPPWQLHASSYAAPAVTGQITGISANIIGPGCFATVAGSVPGNYNNTSHVLTVVPQFTLTFTFVDPVDNCAGLLHTGDTAAFDGQYAVTPTTTIVPAP